MSRKTLMAILAVIGALLVFLKDQFGLALDVTTIMAGITALLLYIFWEAKSDLKLLATQIGRWKDPKFIITAISALLVATSNAFNLNLPVTEIVAVLTLIVGVLFGKQIKNA